MEYNYFVDGPNFSSNMTFNNMPKSSVLEYIEAVIAEHAFLVDNGIDEYTVTDLNKPTVQQGLYQDLTKRPFPM